MLFNAVSVNEKNSLYCNFRDKIFFVTNGNHHNLMTQEIGIYSINQLSFCYLSLKKVESGFVKRDLFL